MQMVTLYTVVVTDGQEPHDVSFFHSFDKQVALDKQCEWKEQWDIPEENYYNEDSDIMVNMWSTPVPIPDYMQARIRIDT